jgi:hypothetical protein
MIKPLRYLLQLAGFDSGTILKSGKIKSLSAREQAVMLRDTIDSDDPYQLENVLETISNPNIELWDRKMDPDTTKTIAYRYALEKRKFKSLLVLAVNPRVNIAPIGHYGFLGDVRSRLENSTSPAEFAALREIENILAQRFEVVQEFENQKWRKTAGDLAARAAQTQARILMAKHAGLESVSDAITLATMRLAIKRS